MFEVQLYKEYVSDEPSSREHRKERVFSTSHGPEQYFEEDDYFIGDYQYSNKKSYIEKELQNYYNV